METKQTKQSKTNSLKTSESKKPNATWFNDIDII